MQNDRRITISAGSSRRAMIWNPQTLLISELWARLQTPARGAETLAEYLNMKKAQQDDLKDVGGFLAGSLSGLRRKAGNVTGRDIITLDLDNVPAGGTEDILRRVEALGCGYCVYSTRKHHAAAPRLRILLPLDRTVTADEYEPLARKLASYIGIEFADPTTFEVSRLMYWPSCCADSPYVYTFADKGLIYADAILAQYEDWRDCTSWPQVPGALSLPKMAVKQGDPESKTGVVGAFCKSYDILRAMDELIPGIYEPVDTMPGRYTYLSGSTAGGAVIYDSGKFLYSHHSTDPCSGKLVNAFDLVRLHRFGDNDDDAQPGTPTNRLPSYVAMTEYAKTLPEVSAALHREWGEEILKTFEKTGTENVSGDLVEFLGSIRDEVLTTDMLRTLLRLLGIKIRLNEITWQVELEGYPKEWSRANAENLLPVKLFDHLRAAGVKGVAKGTVCDGLDVLAEENKYNPVLEMFQSVSWDQRDRLIELYSIWGVGNTFEKILTRKWLIQCVAMACNDENDPQGADGLLVNQGAQGVGKTSSFREIIPIRRMFKEGARLDMREKDTLIQSLSCWVCELGELNRTTVRDSDGLKAFVTQALDEYRTPYARKAVQRPRRTCFCGSVNPEEYLVDETGNRRYWTIHTKSVDLPRLFSLTQEWKEQLWAQLYALYQLNPQGFRLDREERETLTRVNIQHTKALDFELELRDLLNPDLPVTEWAELTATEIAGRLSARPPANKLGRILTKLMQENPEYKVRLLDGLRRYKLPMLKTSLTLAPFPGVSTQAENSKK